MQYSSEKWELVAISSAAFDLNVALSVLSKFTNEYDLNFPTEWENYSDALPPPLPVTFNSSPCFEGVVLNFSSTESRPKWVKPDLVLTCPDPPGAASRIAPDFDNGPLLTFMDVDLKKLTNSDNPGRFQLSNSLSFLEAGSTVQNARVKVDWRFANEPGSSSEFVVGMIFDLETMTLAIDADTKQPLPLNFYCRKHTPADSRKSGSDVRQTLSGVDAETQRLDFRLFTIDLPSLNEDGFPESHKRLGFIDLSEGELVIEPAGVASTLLMRTPGGSFDQNSDKFRWLLQLDRFDPDERDNSLLRIGRKGVTLNALLQPREITLDEDEQLIASRLSAEPLEKSRQGVESRIRIKESKILNAELFARMLVPGTKDLVGELTARMSQRADGTPSFSAALTVEGKESRCSLSIGFFNALLTNPRLGISWNGKDNRWNVTALANAILTAEPEVSLQNGMTELRGENSLIVNDLNLLDLSHKKSVKLSLQIRKFEFSIFGLVGLRLDRVSMNWKWNEDLKRIELVQFNSERAAITFGSGGGTRGGVSLGDAVVECRDGRVRLKSVSGATVTLSVPGQFDFSGTVSWKDDSEDSHFSIQGSLTTFGGLSAGGFLRYGRGIKRNGDEVRQLAVFGERKNLNYPLFSGVVWQDGGFGGGYNVELGNLSRNPSDKEILAKIDSLEPTIVDNWHFVRDNGTYLSLVGKMTFTSQLADPSTICGYVLSIVASIDTNKRILAAGKLWLFSSQKFAEDNRTQPSLVAAMQLDLRRRAITMRSETRRGGAIEAFPQLKEILDRTEAVLLLRLTPNLFDIYLERLTYTQQWLESVDFLFEASWRFSAFQETILTYVRAKVRGNLSPPGFSTSNGGFSFSVEMDSNLEFGGLIGRQGVMTWGEFAANISVSCTAYIEVEFSVPSIKRKNFEVYTEWRTVSKRYDMPRQEIVLGFSGEYAFRGSGGISGGARFQVHFRSNICGHQRSMSKEWLKNPDLVDDVRNHVQHFEAQIDRVAAAATQTAESRAAATSALTIRTNRLLEAAKQSVTDQEEWLAVENPQLGSWALLPTWSTEWLTPKFANTPDAAIEFEFVGQVRKISYKDEEGEDQEIVPAWDHKNWSSNLGFTPPENAEGRLRDLYRLNSLFWESALESGTPEERYSLAERQSLAVNLEGAYKTVIDHRPLQRLRDALTDEDRLTLPADVYPFSYRPGSDPEFEKLERQLVQGENGANRIGQGLSQYRAARSAILALLVEDLDGRGTGLFSDGFVDVLPNDRTVTPYVQRRTFPDNPYVMVKRESCDSPKSVTVIRIGDQTSRDPNVIVVPPNEFVSRVFPAKGCQEFRFKDSTASDSTQSQAEIVIKLPIDYKKLFEAIPNLKTTYFELVDYIRILRKKPGEKGFICVADRVPLPVVISTQEQKHLLKPFVYQEVVSVPDTLDKRTQHYLDGIQYRIQVIPLGWASRPESEFDTLKRDFETVQPFVPAQRRLRGDLALIFDSERGLRGLIDGDNLTARLVTVSASSDETVFPAAELERNDLELFYEPKIIGQTGFYGRSLELEANRSSASSASSNRQDRLNREASGRELSSSVERIQFDMEKVCLEKGLLKIPKQFTAARFFARPAGASPLTALQEIPVYISRSVTEPPSSVPHLELLPANGKESGEPSNVFISQVEASEDDPRHRVQLEWEHPADSELGGIEVEVWDDQEDRVLFTRRIEVLEERVFREHQIDFSVASEWQLVRPDHSQSMQATAARIASVEDFFWHGDRWFSDNDASYKCLKLQLDKFKNIIGDPSCYLNNLKDFWTEVARFQSDPQNDDGPETRAALSNLKYGLIAQLAGMLPPSDLQTSESQTFTKLEVEYVKKRTEIGNLHLQTRLGSSPQDTADKQLDLVAARQLVALMEYRRSFAQQRIENPDRDPPIPTDQDALLIQLRLSKKNGNIDTARALVDLLAPIYMRRQPVTTEVELQALIVPQLPQGDLERHIFEKWLQIENIPTQLELNVLKSRYPLSMWFLERMKAKFPSDSGNSWDGFHPGADTAARILLYSDPEKVRKDIPDDHKGELKRFQITISTETVATTSKSKSVVYCVALQRLLQLTPAEHPLGDLRFQIRPHHSLGLQRGAENELQKSPIPDDLVAYVPQEILDSQQPQFSDSLIQIHFASFLHLLERLGFAVDVALVDVKKGTLTQQELVNELASRLTTTVGFTYFACRGRAIDDGAAVTSEVEFSFVKVVAVPIGFNLSDLLDNRSLKKNTSGTIPKQILDWFQQSLSLLDSASRAMRTSSSTISRTMAGRTESLAATVTMKELIFEHHGGAWTTIPAIGQNCRVSLPLPTLDGQEIFVRIRRLSRYVLIDEWRQAVATSTQQAYGEWLQSDVVSFRPFYALGSAPPAPAKPFGFSGPDRIDFIISQPPDATDSRDNLLTATRTGFKHLGLTFQHRPADGDVLQKVRDNLKTCDHVHSGELIHEQITPASRVLTVFPNETAIALRQLSYFMEVLMELRNHYELANRTAMNPERSAPDLYDPDDPDAPVYLRRQPSLIATRGFQASRLEGGWIVVEVPLVQHGDLLTDVEKEALPNEWTLRLDPDIPDSEDDPSVKDFPDLRCSYFVLFKKNTEPVAVGERKPLEPLFEIKLPLCPGFPSSAPKSTAFVIARSAQVKVRIPGEAEQSSVHAKVRYQSKNTRAYSVVVQAKYLGRNIDVDELVIQTSREGQSQGPPPPPSS